jgi:hypothetical protein
MAEFRLYAIYFNDLFIFKGYMTSPILMIYLFLKVICPAQCTQNSTSILCNVSKNTEMIFFGIQQIRLAIIKYSVS